MRILVTGGAGFIGSNLVYALTGAGHDVLVVDDLSTGSAANLDPRAGFRRLDILDAGFPALVADFSPGAVVHLAAQASVPRSIEDPERDRAVNVDGTRAVAQAALAAGAHRVLSASSAAVYGEPEALPLGETARTEPLSPYGTSKLAAESVLTDTLAGTPTDFASFRFSNVYGPRQDAAGEGGVVAVFCDRLARGERPVVYGDGKQTRDFIYVGDVVAAVMAALGCDTQLAGDGDAGAPYNISTGERSSVAQLLMAIRVSAGYFGPQDSAEARDGDIRDSVLDPGKAERAFGWKARVDLETGIAMTWRWFAASR